MAPLCAWLGSLLALGLSVTGIDPLGGGPTARVDLVLLLWLALGTLPEGGRVGARTSPGAALGLSLGLALGPLGLAVGLDAAGEPLRWAGEHGPRLLIVLSMLVVLRLSVSGAGPRPRHLADLAWLVLVPGWAALELAAGFAAAGSAPVAEVRALSPLGWCATGGRIVDALPACIGVGAMGWVALAAARRREPSR